MKITLPGSIRSKKNSKQPIAIPANRKTNLFKRFARMGLKPVRIILLPSNAYKEWEGEARMSALIQYKDQIIKDSISVKITVYYKGQRPDLSGCMESVGDCLEGVIWVNDKQIESWDGSRLFKDNKNPRTEVEIKIY